MLVFVRCAPGTEQERKFCQRVISAAHDLCIYKAARPGQLHESVGDILKVSLSKSQATVLEPASGK